MTKVASDNGGNWYAVDGGTRVFLGKKDESGKITDQGHTAATALIALGAQEVVIDTTSLYAIPSLEEKQMLAAKEILINGKSAVSGRV